VYFFPCGNPQFGSESPSSNSDDAHYVKSAMHFHHITININVQCKMYNVPAFRIGFLLIYIVMKYWDRKSWFCERI